VVALVKATPGLLPRPRFYTTTWDTIPAAAGVWCPAAEPDGAGLQPGVEAGASRWSGEGAGQG